MKVLRTAHENALRVVCYCLAAVYLLLPSCTPKRNLKEFRVIPATPEYSLQAPNSKVTSFSNVLREYNGFAPGADWVDLVPRMELRIENAYYQAGMPRRGLAGFLGTETATFRVSNKNGLKQVSVQSMPNRPRSDAPVQDLLPPSARHERYYRYFFEVSFNRGGRAKGSVLLGARSRSDLDGLTNALKSNPDAACGNSARHCTVFPEACSVTLEIEIMVNGKPRTVVWGSSLAAIVPHPQRLGLRRLDSGRFVPVKINSPDAQALRLPLLPGDEITWQ